MEGKKRAKVCARICSDSGANLKLVWLEKESLEDVEGREDEETDVDEWARAGGDKVSDFEASGADDCALGVAGVEVLDFAITEVEEELSGEEDVAEGGLEAEKETLEETLGLAVACVVEAWVEAENLTEEEVVESDLGLEVVCGVETVDEAFFAAAGKIVEDGFTSCVDGVFAMGWENLEDETLEEAPNFAVGAELESVDAEDADENLAPVLGTDEGTDGEEGEGEGVTELLFVPKEPWRYSMMKP